MRKFVLGVTILFLSAGAPYALADKGGTSRGGAQSSTSFGQRLWDSVLPGFGRSWSDDFSNRFAPVRSKGLPFERDYEEQDKRRLNNGPRSLRVERPVNNLLRFDF